MVKDLEQVVANAGFVVIDVASGEDGHLARGLGAVLHHRGFGLGCAGAEFARGQGGQPGVFVDAGHVFHQAARGLGGVHGVDCLRHDRNAGKGAVHVGRGQQFLSGADLALLELDGLGAQHGVGEIQVPLVRRHVGALGQVAQVAQVALVDHFPVIFFINTVDLHGLALIDQVKQRGEGAAQADATPAAMTDVKNALHLLERQVFVVKIGVFPVERVTGRSVEVAFACHGGLSGGVFRNECCALGAASSAQHTSLANQSTSSASALA